MAEKVNYLQGTTIEEGEWFALVKLARERGFPYPRGRRQVKDGRFKFLSGMTQKELVGLLADLRAGGWTDLPGARKRHFFRKRGCMLDNPSMCNKHQLYFYTNLDNDENESDMCAICLKRSKRLGIQKVYPEI